MQSQTTRYFRPRLIKAPESGPFLLRYDTDSSLSLLRAKLIAEQIKAISAPNPPPPRR